MNRSVLTIPAATLAAFTVLAASATSGNAAAKTACMLVPAARASALFARPVTTMDRPNPISSGSSTCMYLSGGEPILQLGLTVMATAAVAQTNAKMQQQGAAGHTNVGTRQKGNIVLSAIAMNGNTGMLKALLDAAVGSL